MSLNDTERVFDVKARARQAYDGRVVARLAAIVVIGFVILGAVMPTRALETRLPGDGLVPSLTVKVDDPGRVVRLVTGAPGQTFDAPIVAVPGRSDAIVYSWTGGLCDRSVTIRVHQANGSTSLYRSDDQSPGTCLLAGVSRSIVIVFDGPVDPASVEDITNTLF